RKKLTLKNIFIAILICSALAVLTYYLNNTYYNYRLIFINFMFCGALLFFLQNENFKNKKHIFLTVVAFITSILIFQIRIESTYLFPGMIFGVLLFISLFMLNETKYAIKSNKVLMTAGAISYPCYLLHMMIFEDIYNFTHSHIATITIFIVVCYLLTNYIETPIINKLKNKFLTKAD
ncbi:MAG: acyltransferase family protein, partial [Vampirovibrionales bacterium]